MQIVGTVKGKCRRCYACVWNCPVKAIKVEQGQARVVAERCISCGLCAEVCSQKAKRIKPGILGTKRLLESQEKAIAIVDATMPAAFPECNPGQIVQALRQLGFDKVIEASLGARLLIEKEYSRYFNGEKSFPVITSECPVVVQYIEKFYPDLVKYLAPVASSMVISARWIRKYLDPRAKLVFIGPCAARKSEYNDPHSDGKIQQVLIYRELKQLFAENNLDPRELPVSLSDNPPVGLARGVAISGGFLRALGKTIDILDKNIIVNDDRFKITSLLNDLQAGKVSPGFMEINFCGDCLSGPQIDCNLGSLTRREILLGYVQASQELGDIPDAIDLSREFKFSNLSLNYPTKIQLRDILKATNKIKTSDELNCGACGYGTCREHAVAIFQGFAEKEMCHHYLLEKVTEAKELMLQGEKMVSLGQLAAGIAHELKNPLSGSVMYMKLLLKKMESGEVDQKYLAEHMLLVESEIERCNKIVKNLLNFSRQQPPGVVPVNLNEIFDNSLFLVNHEAQIEEIEIIKDFAEDLPQVLADSTQIEQVFVNLILNSMHAMKPGGKLTLKTCYDRKTREIIAQVTDTGCGISRKHLSKLFTPFFTTKKTKGVGLGLVVARGIIDVHRGKIEVKSVLGKGTTFTIRLGAIKL